MNTSRILGSDSGFNLSWSASPTASCGYIVDWCPLSGECRVEWLKVPPSKTSVNIFSSKSYYLTSKQLQLCNKTFFGLTIHLFGHISLPENFKDGVCYLLSIYACTQGAPVLLERKEGYVREKSKLQLYDLHVVIIIKVSVCSTVFPPCYAFPGIPKDLFKPLIWTQVGSDVEISWNPISLREQTAFITGYILHCLDNMGICNRTGIVTFNYFQMINHKKNAICYSHF